MPNECFVPNCKSGYVSEIIEERIPLLRVLKVLII